MPDPKNTKGYRLGIVNPLTLVGAEIRSILRERSFPFQKVVLLDSSGKAAGAVTEVNGEPALVSPISAEELEDLDLVFFCGDADNNRDWIAQASEQHFIAIDLSRPPAIDDGTLAIFGLESSQPATQEPVLISPHPVAIPIALILHELGKIGRVQSCTATVIQPASEFDQAGVEELAQQATSILNVRSMTKEVFDRQLAFNLYPSPERQETFIAPQILALTDARLELAMMITQGTVFHSHAFSLFVRMEKAVDLIAVKARLAENAVFAFAEGDQEFGVIDAAGRDEILIAEVRAEPSIRNGFWLWAVCDNLRRGSALNAVLIAEKALFTSVLN